MSDLVSLVEKARVPEDIFGALDFPEARAKRVWRKIAAVLHPDRGGDEDLYKKAAEYWQLWQDAVKTGASKAKVSNSSTALTLIARGSVANLFDYNGEVLKVSRTADGDAMVRAEHAAVQKVTEFLHGTKNEKAILFFPQINNLLTVNGRAAFTMEKNADMLTLEELKPHFPTGVPGRHLAWMFRRVIYALRAMEDAGVNHGSMTPDNIMILPESHGLRLTGLTSTSASGKVVDDVREAGRTFASLADPWTRDYKYYQGLEKYPVEPHRLAVEYDRWIEKQYGPRRFVKMELERN